MDYKEPSTKRRTGKDKAKERFKRNSGYSTKHVRISMERATTVAEGRYTSTSNNRNGENGKSGKGGKGGKSK